MDFRRRLPEIRWQSCLSPVSVSVPVSRNRMPSGSTAAMTAGGFAQALEQMPASGHLVGIGRVAGQRVQHAVQHLAALLLEAGFRRAGSLFACAGNAHSAPSDAEKWRL